MALLKVRRQLAMVIDLNKCLGCQTCTLACKTQWTNRNGREYMYWNMVETMPGRGYPRDWQLAGGGFNEGGELMTGRLPNLASDYGLPWEYNYQELLRTGDSQMFGPVQGSNWGPNWDEDQGGGIYPNSYYFYLPRICNHCSRPACLEACPRKAIYKREEDGIVLVDLRRCRGYRYCVESCPYKKVFYNPLLKKAEKCIFCFPRVEKGIAPACARQCVGRIRHVGYLEDREGAVYRLVHEWRVALPLKAQFGTGPNVFYIPPISPPRFLPDGNLSEEPRIPSDLLIDLFGERVPEVLALLDQEMARKRAGQSSELLDTLIAYVHREMFRI